MRKTFTYCGKRYSVTAKTSKAIAERIAVKKKELKQQSSRCVYFNDWWWEWLNTYKCNIAVRTYSSYVNRYNKHIKPYFKNKSIESITHLECQKFFNGLDGYSSNSISKLYHDLHQVFAMAVVNRYITFNPVDGVILPKGDSSTHRKITDEERKAILDVAFKNNCYYILFMLYCGVRPHEASILQGKDISGHVLHIRGVKSKYADRYVPIPDVLLQVLPYYEDEEYIVKSITGISPTTALHRRDLWRSFKSKLSCQINVSDDLFPYCLRHTYCTDLQDAGVPINVARELMGHSSIALTSTIYTHHSVVSFNNANELINLHINLHM